MDRRRRTVASAAVLATVLAALATPAAAEGPTAAAVATVDVAWITNGPDGRVVGRESVGVDSAARRLGELRARPDVLVAEIDRPVEIQSGSEPWRSLQWGLTRIRIEEGWKHAPRADGQVLAVLDTGVEASHLDLAGVVLPGFDVLGTTDGSVDPHGHGTHVAGIAAAIGDNGIDIAGTAPGLAILPVRVLDEAGLGSASDVAAGVYWAVDHGATIINLSLGSREPSGVLAESIRYAVSRGVLVVAAAGNLADDRPVWPAAMPEVIGVTATDDTDSIPSFASRGTWVDLAAPGDGILSTFAGDSLQMLSGTSMAAPLVAGVAALVRAREPELTPRRVRARLIYNAEDIGAPGRDAVFGYGLLAAATTLRPVPAPTDVAAGPHGPGIRDLLAGGIARGCGPELFCPAASVTRGQLTTFLARALRLPPATGPAGYLDTVGTPHAPGIDALAAVGILTSTGSDRFAPNEALTRAEMAALVSRSLGLAAKAPAPFTDVPADHPHAAGIAAAFEAGLTKGCGGDRFCPDGTLTRAQMATLIARAFLGLD